MKNIYVIGGGTAGWFTALLVKKFHPGHNVTLIESSDIGILGAGEGSVPFITNVLDMLDIPIPDLIRECKATFKLGINFVNWNGDGKSYFHSFIYKDEIHNPIPVDQNLIDKLLSLQIAIANGHEPEELSVYEKMAKENVIPFTWSDKNSTLDSLPLNHHGQFSLHFDARLFAVYLAKIAKQRGINRIDAKVKNFEGQEIINSIILEDETKLDCDFVFDCSGFARLVIGKHHNVKWLSYMNTCGLDRAMPFFIDHDNDISPVTDAFCMKNGWIWRIPVLGRYGCGYVYNSKYCTEEEALAEAEEFFGMKLTYPKVFKFEAGTFEKTAVGNSMAVGLSQGFLEPLEATNIWVSALNVIDFLNCDGLNRREQEFIDDFNDRCLTRNTNILEFVYLHYMTKRDDSQFWRDFQKNYPPPERLKTILEQLHSGQSPEIDFSMFSDRSWMQVLHGLRLVDLTKYYDLMKDYYVPYILTSPTHVQTNDFVSHKEILDHFGNFSVSNSN
jgi:tryptophan halogenase